MNLFGLNLKNEKLNGRFFTNFRNNFTNTQSWSFVFCSQAWKTKKKVGNVFVTSSSFEITLQRLEQGFLIFLLGKN